MNKTLGIVFVTLAGIIVLGFSWFVSTNNSLVRYDESVKEKWSQVQNVYQRRADLIPNLVQTVKGYAKHEESVLEEVTQARASVGKVTINAQSAEELKKFDQAQGQLSSALSRLMVISEKYPELKADKGFLALQSELEGTENRIAVERKRFNEGAQEYNTYLRLFPQSIVASSRGFKERPYFEAETAAQSAPKVQF